MTNSVQKVERPRVEYFRGAMGYFVEEADDYMDQCEIEIADLKSKLEAALLALAKIAHPENPGHHMLCECQHNTEECCALVDYHCPECIAGLELAKHKEEV